MESIVIRYGESVTLPIDTGDTTAVSVDIYIGKPGEAHVLTKNIPSLTNGAGTFEFSQADTRLPLDTYYYQINVTDSEGGVGKYPSSDAVCDGSGVGFPEFIVGEALDEAEVS